MIELPVGYIYGRLFIGCDQFWNAYRLLSWGLHAWQDSGCYGVIEHHIHSMGVYSEVIREHTVDLPPH